jgi:hypothetical protein
MRYGELLTRSFSIAWRHPYLWFLALFAGEGAAGGGSGNLGSPGGFPGGGGGGNARGGGGTGPAIPPDTAAALGHWIGDHISLLITVGVVLVVLLVALFLFSCVAQPALIRASAEHDAERPYGLGPALRFGLTAFWRVLGLKLLALAVLIVVFGVGALLVILGVTSAQAGNSAGVAGAIGLGILLLLILIPVAVVLGVVYTFAVRAISLDGRGPISGIAEGFRLLFRRFWRVALVWVIMFGVLLGVGAALGILQLALLIPLALAVGVVYVMSSHAGSAIAVLAVAGIVFLTITFVTGAAIGAYSSTYWTLAYRRLDLEPQAVTPT